MVVTAFTPAESFAGGWSNLGVFGNGFWADAGLWPTGLANLPRRVRMNEVLAHWQGKAHAKTPHTPKVLPAWKGPEIPAIQSPVSAEAKAVEE